MKKNKLYRYLAIGCICLAGVLFLLGKSRQEAATVIPSESGTEMAETETSKTAGTEATGTIYVHVCGAVLREGVYALPAGSRVDAAITAAGGFAADADTSALNLAEELTDGTQVRVISAEEAAEESSREAAAADGKININTADQTTLMTLPGIGASRAEAIIKYREENGGFSDISEIMNVSGIKDALFSQIEDKIKTGE